MNELRGLAAVASLSLLSWALSACGASAPGTGSGEAYPIQLERPSVVGARWDETHEVHVDTTRKTQQAGQAQDSFRSRVTTALRADGEVIAADEAGRGTHYRYQVSSCTRLEDGVRRALLRSGQIVEVRRDPSGAETLMSIDGQPASAELEDQLSEVFPELTPSASPDHIFGSETPRRVGERWDANLAVLIPDFERFTPFRVNPEQARAYSEVLRVTSFDGNDGIDVRSTFEAINARMTTLPEGATMRRSRLSTIREGFLPFNLTLPSTRHAKSVEMEMELAVPTPAGEVITLVHIRMQGTRSIRPR